MRVTLHSVFGAKTRSASPCRTTVSPRADVIRRPFADGARHRVASFALSTVNGASMLSLVRRVVVVSCVVGTQCSRARWLTHVARRSVSCSAETPAHTGVASGRLFDGQGGVNGASRREARCGRRRPSRRRACSSGAATARCTRSIARPGKSYGSSRAGGPVHSSPAVASGLVIAATLGGRDLRRQRGDRHAAMVDPDRAAAAEEHQPGRRMGFLRHHRPSSWTRRSDRRRRRQRLRARPNERAGTLARADRWQGQGDAVGARWRRRRRLVRTGACTRSTIATGKTRWVHRTDRRHDRPQEGRLRPPRDSEHRGDRRGLRVLRLTR